MSCHLVTQSMCLLLILPDVEDLPIYWPAHCLNEAHSLACTSACSGCHPGPCTPCWHPAVSTLGAAAIVLTCAPSPCPDFCTLLPQGPRSDGLDQFNLDDLLKAGLEDHLEEVAGIADTAAQEQALEQALAAMEAAWGEVRLLVAPPPEAEAGARAPTPQLQEGATTSIKVPPPVLSSERRMLVWQQWLTSRAGQEDPCLGLSGRACRVWAFAIVLQPDWPAFDWLRAPHCS